MGNRPTGIDRLRSLLVAAGTVGVIIFNWLSASGRLGSDTGAISDKYPTLMTPAGYAFSIWGLIYVGMIAFTVYQMIPANLARFRAVRSLYIFTCALNCAWLYFWHREQLVICLVVIAALAVILGIICYQLRDPESFGDTWAAKAPFGIYFGWVTAATLVNLTIVLKFVNPTITPSSEGAIAVAFALFAAGLGILVTMKLGNNFYPIAVAWALTAIAVKESGQTLIVSAAALGVVACLIASLSFVMNLRSSENPR